MVFRTGSWSFSQNPLQWYVGVSRSCLSHANVLVHEDVDVYFEHSRGDVPFEG